MAVEGFCFGESMINTFFNKQISAFVVGDGDDVEGTVGKRNRGSSPFGVAASSFSPTFLLLETGG